MTQFRSLALLLLAAMLPPAHAASFTLEPLPVSPGQPVFLRADEPDGCYEVEQHDVSRSGNRITVEIWVSDFIMTPCPAANRTPLALPLGTYAAGTYTVDVQECGIVPPPLSPCGSSAVLSLDIGGAMPRTATVPVFGIVALLLSCSGVVALAFTGLRGPSRR